MAGRIRSKGNSKRNRSNMRKRIRNNMRNNKKRIYEEQSVLTRDQLYLNHHDEEKVLLFATGIVFGVGLSASLLDKFFFGGLVVLVVALVLIFIESNQKMYR